MTDKRARFKQMIAARIKRGDHYMTPEKFIAQMEFYKAASDSGKLETDKVPSTDGR